MNKPTQEQIKEFWEWCGFYQDEDRSSDIVWRYPSGGERILPPIDLNNLFTYAVPMLDGYMMFTGEGGVHFIASKDGLNYEFVAQKEEDAIWGALRQVKEKDNGS